MQNIRLVLGDDGEHNVVTNADGEWHITGVFDLMTAHFGDGPADLSLPVTDYLSQDERLTDAFVSEYLRVKPVQRGFIEHQQLYLLDLKLSFWRYWQHARHRGVHDVRTMGKAVCGVLEEILNGIANECV